MRQLESKTTPIEKYIYLSNLRNSNVHLFYRLVLDNFTVFKGILCEHVTILTDGYTDPYAPDLHSGGRRGMPKMVGNLPAARRYVCMSQVYPFDDFLFHWSLRWMSYPVNDPLTDSYRPVPLLQRPWFSH